MRQHQKHSSPTSSQDSLVIRAHESQSGVVLRLVGSLDFATAGKLTDAINGHGRSGQRLVIDLLQVGFMDLTGLLMLTQVNQHLRARETELLLRVLPGQIDQLLRIAGLESVIASDSHTNRGIMACDRRRRRAV